MLLYTDGFDHYAPKTALSAPIISYLTAAGYTVANLTNATVNIVDGMDAGSLAVKLTLTGGAATPPSVSKSVTTTNNLVVFGFSFRGITARHRIARINGVVDLEWDTVTGKLKIGAALGTDVIILNAWWYFEIELDKTANEIRVWANDTLQLTVALPGGVGTTHTIMWGGAAGATTGTIEFDDFVIVDGSAGRNTARVGPVAIVTRAPTADVTAQWTVVGTANPNHYVTAAQLDPGAAGAPYLQANVAGKTDAFTSSAVLPNNNEVFGVSVVAYARKGDLDNRSVGLTVTTPGGTLEQAKALTEGYQYQQTVFEQAPGAVDWNQNLVETSQFGIIAR